MDSQEIRGLFSRTLVGDKDDEGAWEAVAQLRLNGSREVFEFAAEWLHSETPRARARASAVLGQLTGPAPGEFHYTQLFQDESYALIVRLLEREKESEVLEAALCALGHLSVSGAIPVILRYQDHADPEVRFAVAFALGSFADDPDAVLGLRHLFKDAHAAVRDWSVFGLSFGEADSLDIREDLLRCLDDPDENVREEAAVGLARRREVRLLPHLLKMLDDYGSEGRFGEAARALLRSDPEAPDLSGGEYREALLKQFASP